MHNHRIVDEAKSGMVGKTKTEVNGVFEGGGSKGLVFAGALQECHDRGIEFKAVAGSSAGAMTALAVACGFTPKQTEHQIQKIMTSLGSVPLALAALPRRSVINPDHRKRVGRSGLREVLTEAVNSKICPDKPAEYARTFRDLWDQNEIALYVVTLDMDSGQPLVFSPDLTPDASLVDAVIASSAIPVAFPAQRFEIDGKVRRLADGGVWANYPAFVFLDQDFRDAHRDEIELDDRAHERDTIGFLLDAKRAEPVADKGTSITPLPGKPRTSDLGSVTQNFGVFGALLTSPFTALLVAFMPVLVLALGVAWFEQELSNGMPTIQRMPIGLQDIVLVQLVLVFTFVVVAAFVMAFLVIRLGRALVDEGLVGASAAMGVGLTVPYWVGAGADAKSDSRDNEVAREGSNRTRHIAVRIHPPKNLKTLSKDSKKLKVPAWTAGEEATRKSFAQTFPDRYAENTIAAGDGNKANEVPVAASDSRVVKAMRHAVVGNALAFVCAVILLMLSFNVITAADDGGAFWIPLAAIIPVGAILVVIHSHGRRRKSQDPESGLARLPIPVLAAIMLVAGLGAAAFGLDAYETEALGDGETDFLLPVSGRIDSKEVEGTLVYVDEEDWEEDDVTFDRVVFVELTEDVYFESGLADHDLLYDPNNGAPVNDCGDGDVICYDFVTDQMFSQEDIHADITLLFNSEAGALFLAQDKWTGVLYLPLFSVMAIFGLLLAISAALAIPARIQIKAEQRRTPANGTGIDLRDKDRTDMDSWDPKDWNPKGTVAAGGPVPSSKFSRS